MRHFPLTNKSTTLRGFALILCALTFTLFTLSSLDASAATRVPKPTKKTAKKTTKKTRTTKSRTTKPNGKPTVPTPPIQAPTTTVLTTVATTTTAAPTTTAVPATTTTVPTTTTTPSNPIVIVSSTPNAASTTTTTFTTLPPQPFPAAAAPPRRATAATLDPYRGLGAWVDRFQWSPTWNKKPVFTAATVDQMAAAGVQTLYIQVGHWQTSPDIFDPEVLQTIIDRAHALNMYVVAWYLPAFLDVNTDLRKVAAVANLDIDGIQIDIERIDFVLLRDINVRNNKLAEFNRAVRGVAPGRIISADIVAPSWMDGQSDRWTWTGYTRQTRPLHWGGRFPYNEVVATYDLIALQTYWTENSVNSGWRDSAAFIGDNITRMRAYAQSAGRPDYPIQVIGGLAKSASTLNDLIGFAEAARIGGSFGASLYSWNTTPATWWAPLWGFRSVPDPRFPAPVLPAYVPLAQPPVPVTTTTTIVTTTTTIPGPVPVATPATASTITPATVQVVGTVSTVAST